MLPTMRSVTVDDLDLKTVTEIARFFGDRYFFAGDEIFRCHNLFAEFSRLPPCF